MNDYILYESGQPDELRHYGVLGMKWGVRRDTRLLESSRRNKTVRNLKSQRRTGKISKSEYKTAKKAANAKKKKNISETLTKAKKAKTKTEYGKIADRVNKSVDKEVSSAGIKRGLMTVNSALSTLNTANVVATAAAGSALVPQLAGVYVASAAVGAAAQVGYHHLRRWAVESVS